MVKYFMRDIREICPVTVRLSDLSVHSINVMEHDYMNSAQVSTAYMYHNDDDQIARSVDYINDVQKGTFRCISLMPFRLLSQPKVLADTCVVRIHCICTVH
jgi:hypothetical protein